LGLDPTASSELRLEPGHGDRHGAPTLADLVKRLHAGRLDVVGGQLADPRFEDLGIVWGQGRQALELRQPDRDRGERLGPLALLCPTPGGCRKERRMATEMP
jgi:hypothetical protein